MSKYMQNTYEDKGIPDTYLVFAKIKGHRTWRFFCSNRRKEKIIQYFVDHEEDTKNVTDVKIYHVDGFSGEIKKCFLSIKEFQDNI